MDLAKKLIRNIEGKSLHNSKMSTSSFVIDLAAVLNLFTQYKIFANDNLDLNVECNTKRIDIKDRNMIEKLFNHVIGCILNSEELKKDIIKHFTKTKIIKSQVLLYIILIIIGAEYYIDEKYHFSLGGGSYDIKNPLFVVKLHRLMSISIFGQMRFNTLEQKGRGRPRKASTGILAVVKAGTRTPAAKQTSTKTLAVVKANTRTPAAKKVSTKTLTQSEVTKAPQLHYLSDFYLFSTKSMEEDANESTYLQLFMNTNEPTSRDLQNCCGYNNSFV